MIVVLTAAFGYIGPLAVAVLGSTLTVHRLTAWTPVEGMHSLVDADGPNGGVVQASEKPQLKHRDDWSTKSDKTKGVKTNFYQIIRNTTL